MIEILTSGTANCVQDHGRFGWLNAGVSRSGPMDDLSFMLANRLAGNPERAAGLEVAIFPFRLRFHADGYCAIAGAPTSAQLSGRDLPPYSGFPVRAGDELRLARPEAGARVYLAFACGLDVPLVLGSRATDLKSGWGGFHGRGLNRGDHLALLGADPGPAALRSLDVSALISREDFAGPVRLRVISGAEWDDFAPETHQRLLGEFWTVGAEVNRQGMKLAGDPIPPLRRRDLFSHGIMPGTLQVPPGGRPIIQLAEANTCGGYPKLAHVIEADLWKLGQAGPGTELRFERVTPQQAADALVQRLEGLAGFDRLLRLTSKAQPLVALL